MLTSDFMHILLYSLTFLVLYHYLIYPAVVIFFGLLKNRLGKQDGRIYCEVEDYKPMVTILIAAYNEDNVISSKLDNTLSLEYPEDRREVIVVSDGSNDDTEKIVQQYAERGVIGIHQKERRGKTAALNRGVGIASGEIVVFSDANNDFSMNAINELVKHFIDENTGGVCGRKRIKADKDRESSTGDGLYWRYESAIKLAEGRIGSITTADGEIFAVRKSCFVPMDESIINDDAQITFDIVRGGKRVIYEPAAESFEYASIHIEDDFFVKVRMVAGGFQTVVNNWRFLFPPRTWFGFTFWSHKILRWLMPEVLIGILVVSIVMANRLPYLVFLLLQLMLYGVAAYGWIVRRRRHVPSFIYVPYYFVIMNAAALMGLIRFLSGAQTANWRKAKR